MRADKQTERRRRQFLEWNAITCRNDTDFAFLHANMIVSEHGERANTSLQIRFRLEKFMKFITCDLNITIFME